MHRITHATVGSGPDRLVLKMSQEVYRGSAQYQVSVDGVQIGGVLTAQSLFGSGQLDTVNVLGNFAPGNHTASINFLNDDFGGTPALDRNLHMASASYNGALLPVSPITLLRTGPAGFGFVDTTAV